jgi:DnaJ-class molecular chaperone
VDQNKICPKCNGKIYVSKKDKKGYLSFYVCNTCNGDGIVLKEKQSLLREMTHRNPAINAM